MLVRSARGLDCRVGIAERSGSAAAVAAGAAVGVAGDEALFMLERSTVEGTGRTASRFTGGSISAAAVCGWSLRFAIAQSISIAEMETVRRIRGNTYGAASCDDDSADAGQGDETRCVTASEAAAPSISPCGWPAHSPADTKFGMDPESVDRSEPCPPTRPTDRATFSCGFETDRPACVRESTAHLARSGAGRDPGSGQI